MEEKNTFRVIACCVLFGIMLRWVVATFPYSGQEKPPKFGDFEAHRHWMEITVNLPRGEWYSNSTENDLDYWGLDYPQLSAWHSYVVGNMIQWILPDAVALGTSRGYESPQLAFLMRLSVSLSDIFFIAVIVYHTFVSVKRSSPEWIGVLLAVAAPPFIIVDYGHFQYNCVSLGLTVGAVSLLLSNQMSIGAILFTLAIHHKQMSLYHALPFFSFMTSTVILKDRDLFTGFRVFSTILSTLALLWVPFIVEDAAPDVLSRMFPIKRGIYEDKVGTFWYVLDRFVRIKDVPSSIMAPICGVASLVLSLPSMGHLFWISKKQKYQEMAGSAFIMSLFNVSMVLFMFSYHVHEKTILLPSVGAVLLLQHFPIMSCWFLCVASLSMYPLFYEEDSYLALLFLTALFFVLAQQCGVWSRIRNVFIKLLLAASMWGYVILIIGLHVYKPSVVKPHLFQALIAIYSFAHFLSFTAWFHYQQFRVQRDESLLRLKLKKL